MKTNLTICILGISTCGFAAPSYFLAAGDANLAAINNIAVGAALPNSFVVPSMLGMTPGAFTVRLMVKETTGTSQTFQSGAAMLGFDRANSQSANFANHAAFVAAAQDRMLDMSATSNMTFQNGLSGVDAFGNPISVDVSPLASPRYATAFGTAAGIVSAGIWAPFNFGTSNKLALSANAVVHIASFSLESLMIPNQQYANLSIVDIQGATSKSTFLTPGADNSVVYTVRTVPEPLTILTLFGGLATIIRRKSKPSKV
ncbi:MAG: PEP-CTERM sorting domain-containing protein [Armatimonadetes bacterium]|nr:PEP-CTERM sorting domain-containing protein [Armatimonadota bacterium]